MCNYICLPSKIRAVSVRDNCKSSIKPSSSQKDSVGKRCLITQEVGGRKIGTYICLHVCILRVHPLNCTTVRYSTEVNIQLLEWKLIGVYDQSITSWGNLLRPH